MFPRINRRTFCLGLGMSVLPFTAACSKKKKKPVDDSSDSGNDTPVASRVAMMTSINNLKQIVLSFHNYESAYQYFPTGMVDPKTGRLGLSWRVQILPFIEQENLYRQFRLNEPWDSEHNIKLLSLMPKTFASTGAQTEPGHTFYQGFATHWVDPKGQEIPEAKWGMITRAQAATIFPDPRAKQQAFVNPAAPPNVGCPVSSMRINSIVDGTSNTFLIAEAGQAVPWTKPADIQVKFGINDFMLKSTKDLKLGGMFGGDFHVAFADGFVVRIKKDIPPEKLLSFIGYNDGMMPDFKSIGLEEPAWMKNPPKAFPEAKPKDADGGRFKGSK